MTPCTRKPLKKVEISKGFSAHSTQSKKSTSESLSNLFDSLAGLNNELAKRKAEAEQLALASILGNNTPNQIDTETSFLSPGNPEEGQEIGKEKQLTLTDVTNKAKVNNSIVCTALLLAL
jgi:hypothetical protein